MCHKVWMEAMPYKLVEIEPEQKFKWSWRINDSINFIFFKWNFEHNFKSLQEEHEAHLLIRFEDSNQVSDFEARILYETTQWTPIQTKVTLQVDKLTLKDPLLSSVKIAFLEIIKGDYKQFLDNLFTLLQNKEKRLQILKDCYWINYQRISFDEKIEIDNYKNQVS